MKQKSCKFITGITNVILIMMNNPFREMQFNNYDYFDESNRDLLIENIVYNIHEALNAKNRMHVKENKHNNSYVLNHGFPELYTFSPGEDGQYRKLCQSLATYITFHEPRLQDIKVEVFEHVEKNSFAIKFKIYGILRSTNSFYAVQLASVFDLNKTQFFVYKDTL